MNDIKAEITVVYLLGDQVRIKKFNSRLNQHPKPEGLIQRLYFFLRNIVGTFMVNFGWKR